MILAFLLFSCEIPQPGSGFCSGRPWQLKFVERDPRVADRVDKTVVLQCFAQDAMVHPLTLEFVRREQSGTTPPLQSGCELPAQICRIADAKVHPVAAGGRAHLGGVAYQEDAALRIAPCNQRARRPSTLVQ